MVFLPSPPQNVCFTHASQQVINDVLSMNHLFTNTTVSSDNLETEQWHRSYHIVLIPQGTITLTWQAYVLPCSSDSGAFMIPYLIMVILCGIPLLFMEFAIGQYTRLGPVHALAKICPLLKGEWLSGPKSPLTWRGWTSDEFSCISFLGTVLQRTFFSCSWHMPRGCMCACIRNKWSAFCSLLKKTQRK